MNKFLSLLFLSFTILTYSQNAPVASDEVIAVNEGLTKTGTLDGTDADSNALSWTVVGAPKHGTLTLNTNGSYSYVHSGSETTSDTFTFKATDNSTDKLESDIATATITITPVNDAPTLASPISITVDEEGTIETILGASDEEGATIVYSVVTAPTQGTFTLSASTGIGYYTHNGSETTSDTITVRAKESDGALAYTDAVINVTVTAVNDAPAVSDGELTINEAATSDPIAFTASDAETSAEGLTIAITSQGNNGTATVSGLKFSYVHDGSETTTDSFGFSVSDGVLSSTGTINIVVLPVNDNPLGVADLYFISTNNNLAMDAAKGVLRNDTDADTDFSTLTASLGSTTAQYGTVELAADGSFTYITTTEGASASYTTDTFSYKVNDGASDSAETTVTLEVATVIATPDAFTNTEGGTLQVPASTGVISNDIETNNLTVTAEVVNKPAYGVLTFAADGSFSYVHDGSENLRDVFTYKLKNANDDESKATFVAINSTNVNDTPTSVGTAFTLNEGASLIFTPTYVDTDTALTGITFAITATKAISNGFLVNNNNGTFTYTHDGGQSVVDAFTYTINDGEFTVASTGTILVTTVNDQPVATALTYTLNEAASQVVALAGTDADGDTLGFSISTAPKNGSVVLSGSTYTYTHDGTETTSDSFAYIANDGVASSSPASVALTITAVNTAPVVTNLGVSLNEGATSSFTLANNASDQEGNTITYIVVSVPTNGSLKDPGNSDAAITAGTTITGASVKYIHDGNENIKDTFTFKVNDSTSDSNIGTVTATIAAVNDTPVFTNFSPAVGVDQYDEVTFNLPVTDAEGTSLTYAVTSTTTKGLLEANSSGTFTYYNSTETLAAAATTTDAFSVTASDGVNTSAAKTLTITITGIDDSKPQLILSTASSALTEGGGDVTVEAVLISNDFYSKKRYMNAEEVAIGVTNSLGYNYLGEADGKKYYLSTTTKEFGEAQADAKSKGGYLFALETAAENTAVSTLVENATSGTQYLWMGLEYNYTDTAWVWENAATYDVTNYNSYDASSTGGNLNNPYVYARFYDSDAKGRWFNVNSGNRNYIIEYDNSFTATSAVTLDVAVKTGAGNSTAEEGSDKDFTKSTGSLTIAVGSNKATFTLSDVNDGTDEGPETIVLEASNVSSNARIKNSQKTITINHLDDDDTTVAFTVNTSLKGSLAADSYDEGTDSQVVITATLAKIKSFDTALTLNLSGTALIDDDYSTNDDGFLTSLNSTINYARGVVKGTISPNAGVYFVAEGSSIYKIDAAGNKTTYASGGYGSLSYAVGGQPIGQAKFREIEHLALSTVSGVDYLYISDRNTIRKVNLTTNLVFYVAGSYNWSSQIVNGTPTQTRFRDIRDIAVAADGTTVYVTDNNTIRKIALVDGAYVSSILTGIDTNDWRETNGTLSQARFMGPTGIAMDTNGDLIVREYGALRKIDIDGDSVTTILNTTWARGDVSVDSSNNIYFSDYDNHKLFEYSAEGELFVIIDSSGGSGTVDGILKDAKIYRPYEIIVSATELAFVEHKGSGSLRKIDFVNKLRIPAGQQTGTFTLNIEDDSKFEVDETILLKVAAADKVAFNSSTTVKTITIDSEDTAPVVSLTASNSLINEEGGTTILTFQLGDAGESGSRLDMSSGFKGEYYYMGTKDDHKYYMSYDSESWTDANQIAQDLGGYLVAVDNATENSWLRTNIDPGYTWSSFWIGYNDQVSEGKFVWSNGGSSTYENWNNGEPNNSGGEDFTELLSNGKWNDLPNHGRRFIIEFSGSVSSLPTVITYAVTGETSDFTYPDATTITIPAGQGKASLTVTAIGDDSSPVSEGQDSLTYTMSSIADSNGTINADKKVATVTIIDNEKPLVAVTNSATEFNENGAATVSVTAALSGTDASNAKLFDSKLPITINPNNSDTAVLGKDYEIVELSTVSTLAGTGSASYSDGIGTAAAFDYPRGMIKDASGNLYIADTDNYVVRKVTPDGVVSTYAGTGNWSDDSFSSGPRAETAIARPQALAINTAGELFIYEGGRHRIVKVDTSGNLQLVSGNNNYGDVVGDKTTSEYRDVRGMVFDSAGNLFVTDDNKIKKIVFDGAGNATSSQFVGSGNWGESDGTGAAAEFRGPYKIIADASDNLFVTDKHNNAIRKITSGGVVTLFAGGDWGEQNGTLLSARFQDPTGLSIDSEGNMYVTEDHGNRLRKITLSGASGFVSTVAGTGTYGNTDGDFSVATFKRLYAVANSANAIYLLDRDGHAVRKIDIKPTIKIASGQTSGSITLRGIDDFVFEADETITYSVGTTVNVSSSSDFSSLAGVTLKSNEIAPVAKIISSSQNVIGENAGTATVSVVLTDAYSSARNDMDDSFKSDYYYLGAYDGSKYYSSKSDDHRTWSSAKVIAESLGGQLAIITSDLENEAVVTGIFNNDPNYDAVDRRWLNHWIGLSYTDTDSDEVDDAWVWSNGVSSNSFTNWGSGEEGKAIGTSKYAWLHYEGGWWDDRGTDHRRFVIEFSSAHTDAASELTFTVASSDAAVDGTDFTNNLTANKITIAAGSYGQNIVFTGVNDDVAESVETVSITLDAATNATVSSTDNTANLVINDDDKRDVTMSFKAGTFATATTDVDGVDGDYINEADGATEIVATVPFTNMEPLTIDLAFTNSGAGIALLDIDFESGDINRVSTLAGSGEEGYLDGDGAFAEFGEEVRDMVTDASGNIYVAEQRNGVIRKITPDGTVTTWAGNKDNWGDQGNGDKLAVSLSGPRSLAFDGSGNLYVAEAYSRRISKIDASGNVTRVGNVDGNYGNNNGDLASEAQFEDIRGLAFDSTGNLFVLETRKLRKISFSGTSASIADFVGNGDYGNIDAKGVDARWGDAYSMVIDSKDNLYFTDVNYNTIKKVTPDGVVTTIAGNNWGDRDGYGTNASFRQPHGLTIDSSDNIYVADSENNSVRKLTFEAGNKVKVSTVVGSGNEGFSDGLALESKFHRPKTLAVSAGQLYINDTENHKIRAVQLVPQITIPALQTTASFNISSINDITYETWENIQVTSTSSTGTILAASQVKNMKIKSEDTKPQMRITSESLVLDEEGGVLTLNVELVEAGGSNVWKRSSLASAYEGSYNLLGNFEGHSYYYSNTRTTYLEAKKTASDLGGQLLVLETAEENEFIGDYIYDGTWIGTEKTEDETEWSNIYGDATYTNFYDYADDEWGYAFTWGNKWESYNGQYDERRFVIEYGPVKSSELSSEATLVIETDAVYGNEDATLNDFTIDKTTVVIAPGASTTTITLTGVSDTVEEDIEKIKITLSDPKEVALSADANDLTIKINDNEAPVVTYTVSNDTITENKGILTLTANLNHAKMSPTLVSLDLSGTATLIDDYLVSSIYQYGEFAGTGDSGTLNGTASQAQFQEPFYINNYIDGSLLVSGQDGTIRRISNTGQVTNLIDNFNQVVQTAVTASGVIYLGKDQEIWKYDPSKSGTGDEFSKFLNNVGTIGGIAVSATGDVYYSSIWDHKITKVTVDAEGNKTSTAVVDNGYDWPRNENYDEATGMFVAALGSSDAHVRYPGRLLFDDAKNTLYVTNAYREWCDDCNFGGPVAIDFNANTISDWQWLNSTYDALMESRGINNVDPSWKGMDMDSDGNLFFAVPTADAIVKVSFNAQTGLPYIASDIKNPSPDDASAKWLAFPMDISIVGSVAYVTSTDNNTIDKINLSAIIAIPADQQSVSVEFNTFKDPWFEEDEVIDIKGAITFSGTTAAVADINAVTIIEATRLSKVADSPFIGIEDGKVSWGDFDQDGDMDLALMGKSSEGTVTNVYRNNSGVFDNTNFNFTKFIAGDIEFVDVDQDGYLDLAVSGNTETGRKAELYMNIDGEDWEMNSDYNVEGLSQSDMEWADLDNDGDTDLIMSGIDAEDNFQNYYYTNLGNFDFRREYLFFGQGFIKGEIDIVDEDQDGDNDLFVAGTGGDLGNQYNYRRAFDNSYYNVNFNYDYDQQYNSNVRAGFVDGNTEYLDIDGDGSLDYLTIGFEDDANFRVQSNLTALANLPILKNPDFDFADYNNDGQSDLIYSGEDPDTGSAVTKLYTSFPDYFGNTYGLVESNITLQGLRESSVDWIDYDKDGDLDLFMTGLDELGVAQSILYKAENQFNYNEAPAKITGLKYTDEGNGLILFEWDKPNDNISTNFRYDIKIGTTTGGDDVIYSNSNSTTGATRINVGSLSTLNNRKMILNPGTYYVSVQAIDGGNKGGLFSDELSFTIDYEWKRLNLGGIIDRRLRPEESTQLDFMDMDGDGDKDLISTKVGSSGYAAAPINILSFDEGVFIPVRQFFYGGDTSFEFGDFNNDGEMDIIVAVEESGGNRIHVLLNTRKIDDERPDDFREYFQEHYAFEGDNFVPNLFNIEFAIKDLNNDGLVEILAAGESSKLSDEAETVLAMISVVPSNGTDLNFNEWLFSPTKSVIPEEQLNNLSFASYDFGDYDNDGDFDFLISGYSFDGYKTKLFENKRKLDENGVVVEPIEVFFEEVNATVNNFVSVKSGTTDLVDFNADGKLDVLFSGQSSTGDIVKAYSNDGADADGVNKFTEINVGLPAVREGRFVFGDFDSNGYSDVLYSGTVSGEGKVTRLADWIPETNSMLQSDYDLSFYVDANIGVADFDGDLDADFVITGLNKYDKNYSEYIADVYINVRGFAGPAEGSANNENGFLEGKPLKKAVGVKKTYGNNSRPNAPSGMTIQRSRIGDDQYEMFVSWNAASDNSSGSAPRSGAASGTEKTPDAGLTYSLKIGTTPGGEEILASGADADGVKTVANAGNAENNTTWKVAVPSGVYYVQVQSIDNSYIGSEFSEASEKTITSSFKLGDSTGDDTVNILDLTSNLDYILGNVPAVFVKEVADVNGDGKIDVVDISGIVNIILTAQTGAAQGSSYDPYDWEYFSNKPIGDASLVYTRGKVYLENDMPVTSIQFSIDSNIDYELSEELGNLTVVTFVEDDKRNFLIYSFNNQPINEITDVIFNSLDLFDDEKLDIGNLKAGTNDGLSLNLKYSDERFFDSLDSSIQMYPNPASSNINLLTDITKDVEALEVNIYNILGVSVFQTSIDSMGRLNDIDVSMLASGLYTVQVKMKTKDNEEVISVHKLIKK